MSKWKMQASLLLSQRRMVRSFTSKVHVFYSSFLGKRKAADEGQPETKKVKLDPATQETTSIFVGQLSWSIDNDRLAQEFSQCGEVLSATVQLDRNTGRSRGFGYVHFSTADAVEKALKMNGSEIDGRAIRIDRSTPPTSSQIRDRRAKAFSDEISPPCNTLFIGNLPFSITEDALWSYFEGYSVKTIRLPTDRESGQPKGFGYVELENVEDAKKAFEALSGSEIEGRRIRLDYSPPRDSFGGDRGGGRGGRGGGRGRGGDRGGRGWSNDRGGRGGFNDRGGRGGGFNDRGGRGGRGRGRGAPRGTPRSGGITPFEGKKVTF
jgi:nucleolin